MNDDSSEEKNSLSPDIRSNILDFKYNIIIKISEEENNN